MTPYEAEERRRKAEIARLRQVQVYADPPEDVPVDTEPAQKWRMDVYGKVAATLIAAVAIAFGAWVWSEARILSAATVTVYALPPRVDKLEMEVARVKAQPTMPPDLATRLDKFLQEQEKAKH